MGKGKVKLGHSGFKKRVRNFKFSKRNAGENVAYVGGISKAEMPKVRQSDD